MIVKCTLNDGSSDHVLDDYIIDNGIQSLTVRVESDKPGEPGVVAFDGMSMEFDESDLGSLFTPASLAAAKAAGDKYTVKISLGFVSDYDVFYGMVDFDSVEYTQDGTVKFEVIDFIQALKYVTREDVRVSATFNSGAAIFALYYSELTPKTVYISKLEKVGPDFEHTDWTVGYFDFTPGEVWMYDDMPYLVLGTTIEEYSGVGWTADCLKVTLHNDFSNAVTSGDQFQSIDYYEKNIYGEDFYNYGTITPTSFDGLEIVLKILDMAWPSLTINTDGMLYDSYPVSLDLFDVTGVGDYEKDIFGAHPAEAMKRMISSMRLYMYFGMNGTLYLIDKPDSSGTPDITIDTTTSNDIEWLKRFSWAKKVDCVHVTTEFLGGDEEAYYPDNLSEESEETINIDVIKFDDYTLAELAEDIWEFYGKRHLAMTITMPLTETLAAELGIMKQVRVDSVDYFLYEYTIDIEKETVELQLASYQTWEN